MHSETGGELVLQELLFYAVIVMGLLEETASHLLNGDKMIRF